MVKKGGKQIDLFICILVHLPSCSHSLGNWINYVTTRYLDVSNPIVSLLKIVGSPELKATFETIIEVFLFLDKIDDGKLNKKDMIKDMNEPPPSSTRHHWSIDVGMSMMNTNDNYFIGNNLTDELDEMKALNGHILTDEKFNGNKSTEDISKPVWDNMVDSPKIDYISASIPSSKYKLKLKYGDIFRLAKKRNKKVYFFGSQKCIYIDTWSYNFSRLNEEFIRRYSSKNNPAFSICYVDKYLSTLILRRSSWLCLPCTKTRKKSPFI